MIHSTTSRKVALLASAALVGSALAAAPVAAQGDPNVCDGVIEGPVALDMTMHTGSNPGAEMATVEAFNAGPGAELGVSVNVIAIGEQAYETAITSAAAAGEMPDLVDMDGPTLYPFAFNGLLRPITSCADEEKLGYFLGSIIEQGTYNGELYSLGSFESGMGIWAHKSMLEDIGARIPTGIDDAWTGEEFDQVLRDLQAAGYGANGPLDIKWHYGAGEWRAYGFAPMIQSAGGDLIDRSTMKSAAGVLNGPEAVGALTQFQTWINDGLVDLIAEDDNNFTVGPDGAPNTGDETPLSWVGHWMHSLYSENLGDDLILLPLPDFGNGSKGAMGSWNWAASSGADGIPNSGDEADLDAVWAFIDYATSPESVRAFRERLRRGASDLRSWLTSLVSRKAATGPSTSTTSPMRTPIRTFSRTARWRGRRRLPTCSSATASPKRSPTSWRALMSSRRWTTSCRSSIRRSPTSATSRR